MVQLEGLVILKIIKHAHSQNPESRQLISGQLLGLQKTQVMHVSNSFPAIKNDKGS